MSYSAQGWAQRRKFGSPYLKAVMQAHCYLMRDDQLTVFASIHTLEDLTEFEERVIRKTVKELVDLGELADTGKRVRNQVVYRLPRFEAWLARADETNTPVQGRVDSEATAVGSEVVDTAREKLEGEVSDNDPSPAGEGFPRGNTTPPVQGHDPSRAGSSTPPLQGSQSSLNPRSTKPARARSIEDWKQKARVLTDRAPEKATKETKPGSALKGHMRFWRRMVDWYGKLWLVQTGDWPTAEWIRLLNLWNDSGSWRELDQVLEAMTLDRPVKPPMLGEIEQIFRKVKGHGTTRYDEPASRRYWFNFAQSEIFGLAPHYGMAKFGVISFDGIELNQRHRLQQLRDALVAKAIAGEKEIPPTARRIIEQSIHDELVGAMKGLNQLSLPAPEPLPDEAFV